MNGMSEAMVAMQVTEDERDLLAQMRDWKDGMPDAVLPPGKCRLR